MNRLLRDALTQQTVGPCHPSYTWGLSQSRQFYQDALFGVTQEGVGDVYSLTSVELNAMLYDNPEDEDDRPVGPTDTGAQGQRQLYVFEQGDERQWGYLVNMRSGEQHIVNLDRLRQHEATLTPTDLLYYRYNKTQALEAIWTGVMEALPLDELFVTEGRDGVTLHPGTSDGIIVKDIIHPCQYLAPGVGLMGHVGYEGHEDHDRFRRPYVGAEHRWISHQLQREPRSFVYEFKSLPPNVTLEHGQLLAGVFNRLFPHLQDAWRYVQAVSKGCDFQPGDDERSMSSLTPEDLLRAADVSKFMRGRLHESDLDNLPAELQVYIKVVDITIGAGSIYKGVWHLEGLPEEHIVATALYYPPCALDSQIIYKRQHYSTEVDTMVMVAGQDSDAAWELRHSFMPLGTVQLDRDQAHYLVFPNTHIHRVQPIHNPTAAPIHRQAVAFFLVDPHERLPKWSEVASPVPTEEQPGVLLRNMESRMKLKGSLQPLEINFCEH